MEEPSLSTWESPLDWEIPAPKRRKLRKGTRSGWECKWHKAWYTFAAATKDVCEACRRRGTDCVSQEYAEQSPPKGSNTHLVDRLGRVESLVGRLLKGAVNNGHSGGDVASPIELRQQSYGERSKRPRPPTFLSQSPLHTSIQARERDLSPGGRKMTALQCVPFKPK